MQKAFKHQACLNVFDGIWKNQLTFPGWRSERRITAGEAIQPCPCAHSCLGLGHGAGGGQAAPNGPGGGAQLSLERGGEPICKDSFQLRGGESATRPGFISHLQIYLKVFQEPEATVSLCQHQQHGCCPQTCFHHHTLLLSVENNPEQGISMLHGDLACVWPHFPLPGEKVILQMILF